MAAISTADPLFENGFHRGGPSLALLLDLKLQHFNFSIRKNRK
jgi:hypothetical protein